MKPSYWSFLIEGPRGTAYRSKHRFATYHELERYCQRNAGRLKRKEVIHLHIGEDCMKDNETRCVICHGAGLVPDAKAQSKVAVCQTCNGFGVLAVNPITSKLETFAQSSGDSAMMERIAAVERGRGR